MTSDGRLRAAVIGVGGIGRTHLRVCQALSREPDPLCTLAAVCDVDPEALETARQEFAAPRAYTDYRALFDDPDIDVVSLCVPHHVHRELSLAGIASDKHLLLEKPVGMTHGEAMEIATAANAGRGTTGVIFQSRFDPGLRFVRDEVMPRLGPIRFATSREYHWRGASYYASGAWRGTWKGEGGGLLVNQCIHGWDVFQWLLGGVDYAYGYWANLLHPTIEVEDTAYAFVRLRGPDGKGFPAKAVATTCLAPPPVSETTPWRERLSIHVVAEGGEVIANDFRAPRIGLPMADFRLGDERLERELRAGMDQAIHEAAARGQAAGHETNIRAFLEAVRAGTPPPVLPGEAAEVHKMIDGVHWHGWNHADAFREWAASLGPLPADADDAKARGWDGGDVWRALLGFVEDPTPGLEAPFVVRT